MYCNPIIHSLMCLSLRPVIDLSVYWFILAISAKLPFVFITSGQRENGRWVDKLVKNLIARLEEDKINVVADLHEELYFSKDLMVGLVMEMECLESFSRYLLNKVSNVECVSSSYVTEMLNFIYSRLQTFKIRRNFLIIFLSTLER